MDKRSLSVFETKKWNSGRDSSMHHLAAYTLEDRYYWWIMFIKKLKRRWGVTQSAHWTSTAILIQTSFQRLHKMGVPEIITADQHYFRDLMFFSVDSENMENISAKQCHLQDAFLATCLAVFWSHVLFFCDKSANLKNDISIKVAFLQCFVIKTCENFRRSHAKQCKCLLSV